MDGCTTKMIRSSITIACTEGRHYACGRKECPCRCHTKKMDDLNNRLLDYVRKSRANKIKAFSAVIIGGISLGIFVGIIGDAHKRVQLKAEQAIPTYRITAWDLFEHYSANEVKTDQELHGKRLVVTGRIVSIDKDFTGSVIVQFATISQFKNVTVHLHSGQENQAAVLVKGSEIVVKCDSSVLVLESPQLHNCTLLDGTDAQ